jgi:hypothetical protein
VKARLESLGFTVTVKSDNSSATADASGKVLVFVAESSGSTSVTSKFRDVAVPVVACEAFIYDDMRMTGTAETEFDYQLDTTEVTIVDASHPLAAGLSGPVAISTANARVMWGIPGSAAKKVATLVGKPTQITVFAYEAGADMVGQKAPARRVGLFIDDVAAGALTTNGTKLLDAAIVWAASK